MNALYTWIIDEIVVTDRMNEMRQEADKVRQLRDAGIIKPSLYERTGFAFGNTLVKLGQRLQRKFTHLKPTYKTTGGKYAV